MAPNTCHPFHQPVTAASTFGRIRSAAAGEELLVFFPSEENEDSQSDAAAETDQQRHHVALPRVDDIESRRKHHGQEVADGDGRNEGLEPVAAPVLEPDGSDGDSSTGQNDSAGGSHDEGTEVDGDHVQKCDHDCRDQIEVEPLLELAHFRHVQCFLVLELSFDPALQIQFLWQDQSNLQWASRKSPVLRQRIESGFLLEERIERVICFYYKAVG